MQPAQIVQTLGASHAALTRGAIAEAERLLAPVLALPNAPAKAVYLLGLIRSAEGRLSDAVTLMRQALKAAPSDHECWNSLGALYVRAKQNDAAIACFEQAIACNSRYGPGYLNLANALLAGDRVEEAETRARQLLALGASEQALTLLGSVLRRLGRYQEALQALDGALKLNPRAVHARHDRAIVLDKLGAGQEAIAEYALLHKEGLSASALYRNWAGALLDLGRLQEAEEVLQTGAVAFPSDVVLQDNLARLRWLSTGERAFARDFRKAVDAQPDNIQMRLGYGDLLRRSGQLEASSEVLREGLKRRPDDPVLLGALGVVLGEMDRLEEAELALRRSLPGRETDWSHLENLVEVLLRNGKAREALAHIEAAQRARPRDQAWIAHRASALCMLGDPAYGDLYDFAAMVRGYDLPAPHGFSSSIAFNETLIEHLRALHRLKAHPLDQSLVNGTQTSKSLLETKDPVLLAFLGSVEEAMAQYVRAMPNRPEHPFWGRKPASGRVKLVGCWSVRLNQGGYHVNHIHPEGWISSAYYAVVPREAQGANDHQGWIQFGAPRWPTPGVEAKHFVEPAPGRLVLFPSYMWHGTVPFTQADERLTIAMDAVPLV